MEVHHHPQIEKKNFKEYFLEFLMIFLAVTLGFFAESLREKIVNNEKAIHYLQGIVDDLKQDTAELSDVMQGQDVLLKKMDSALSIPVAQIKSIDVQDTFFHYFYYFYVWEREFIQNNNTFTQLSNGSGFSVISRQETIDSISLLNTFCINQVIGNEKYYLTYYDKVVECATHLMDLPVIPLTYDDTLLTKIPYKKQIFTRYDIPSLKELYSKIGYEKGSLAFFVLKEKTYREKAIGVINYLNKEYELRKE
jgi:hypothetical protein